MALTPDDEEEAFRFLVKLLRERGFGWVVTQVEEKIALGKVRAQKLRARKSTEDHQVVLDFAQDRPSPVSRRGLELFTTAEQYTASERLNILIESINIAVTQINQVARQTFINLKDFGVADVLRFEPEAAVSEPFQLHRQDLDLRQEHTAALAQLVNQLLQG